jgi:hypothetical protein
MDELEQEVARIDAGGETWDEEAPAVDFQVKRPLGKVVPIHLSAEQWDQIYQEANELGLGPAALMRMWVLERLRAIRKERQSA